jgi:hypothetical protein
VNPKTVANWRKRDSVTTSRWDCASARARSSCRSKKPPSSPFGFRPCLPLDDVFYALKLSIPARTRSTLHRPRLPTPLASDVLGVLFCWRAYRRLLASPEEPSEPEKEAGPRRAHGEGKRKGPRSWSEALESGKGVAGALHNTVAILEDVLRDAPAAGAKSVA